MKPLVIAVSGGSASGKTTVVSKILKKISLNSNVTKINHDDYYKPNSNISFEERKLINYDHPDSLDNELLINNLKELIKGNCINKPLYDFVNYARKEETEKVCPKKVIILEGILILNDPYIREISDIKIYVDADEDLMFIRRLKRDITERGRTVDSVINQYLTTVKPMYYKYVKPCKRYADVIIPNDKGHDVAVDLISAKIKDILSN